MTPMEQLIERGRREAAELFGSEKIELETMLAREKKEAERIRKEAERIRKEAEIERKAAILAMLRRKMEPREIAEIYGMTIEQIEAYGEQG